MAKKISLTEKDYAKIKLKDLRFFLIKLRIALYPPPRPAGSRFRSPVSLAITSKTFRSRNKQKHVLAVMQLSRPQDWSEIHIYWVQIPFEPMLPSCAVGLLRSRLFVVQTPNMIVEGFRPYPSTRICRMLDAICWIVKIFPTDISIRILMFQKRRGNWHWFQGS